MRPVIRANRTAGVPVMKRILVLGAALGIALSATAASAQTSIGAKPAPANTPSGTATPSDIPAGGLGMAILGASVNSSGGVLFGSGVTGAVHLNPGIYEVDFNRDVTQCIYTASSFNATVPVLVEPRSGDANGIFLEFSNINASPSLQDSQFYLTVNCFN
jgi:hypothetical protein